MKRSTPVRGINTELPSDLPERTFTQDIRADVPRFLVFQVRQPKGLEVRYDKLDFESSFIDLYTISRAEIPDAPIGYCIDVKRGMVQNLGVSLIIRTSKLEKKSKGRVNIDITQTLKFGDVLRIFKLGDSALFVGVPNDYPPFFY